MHACNSSYKGSTDRKVTVQGQPGQKNVCKILSGKENTRIIASYAGGKGRRIAGRRVAVQGSPGKNN
jgi:hypothetical protein